MDTAAGRRGRALSAPYHSMGRGTMTWLFLVLTASWWNIATGVSLPTCQAAAPALNNLTAVRTAYTSPLAGAPFDVIYANENNRAFVAGGQYVIVLDTSTFPPTVLNNVSLSTSGYPVHAASGMTLARGGKYVLVTLDTSRLAVVDAKAAVDGNDPAVVGYIFGNTTAGASDVEVVSDGTFAFVSNEYGSSGTDGQGTVEVFKLTRNTNGSVSGQATGYIVLDVAVVGTAFSPDKTLLYTASEDTSNGTICNIYGGSENLTTTPGTISVLNVTQLETNPSQALASQAEASSGAVRVIVSPDGKYVWIASRESNHLLAYDAEKLSSDPSNALIASVQVGTSPIDLTFARNYSLILTADSNRFGYTNTTVATAGLSVVDVRAALAGEPAVIGSIPTGYLPRAFATSPDGQTILVALFNSQTVQAIDVSTLPFASTSYRTWVVRGL